MSLSTKKVLIIGLGQIGYSNAEYMTRKGLIVHGYDINAKAVEHAIRDQIIEKKAENFTGYDYYIICISTHQSENIFVPYLEPLFDIAKRIETEGTPGALVGIDSTITRGTSMKVLNILNHKQHVVHVPHRFYGPEKQEHGVGQTRVLGGCGICCIDAGKIFYGQILGIPLHEVSSIEVAELSKITENSYRFIEIAFAEELKIFCDGSGIDFHKLRSAINTKWNIHILEAKTGIGGHCLPKDSEMFLGLERSVLDTSIIEAAKTVDSEYRTHVNRCCQYLLPQESKPTNLAKTVDSLSSITQS
jgi:nucleotide sugar dehydrogenase